MSTNPLFTVFNRKKDGDCSFSYSHQTLPSLLSVSCCGYSHACSYYTCCSPEPHFFFQHPFLTLPDVTLYLRKALGNSHHFVKPSQCFAYWFLKFISRGYPLFLTFVNNISMNTTKCSFQCLLFELCKLWWCLTNWLLDKKVDILCSDRVI